MPTKVVNAKEQNKEKFIKKIQIIAYMNVSTYHSLSSNVVSLAKLSSKVYFSLSITTAFFDFTLPPPYMHSRRPLSSASFLSLVGVQPTLQSNHGTKELKGKSKKKIFSQKFYTNGKQSVRFRGIIRESDNDTNNLQRKMNLAIMVKSSEKRRVQKWKNGGERMEREKKKVMLPLEITSSNSVQQRWTMEEVQKEI